MRISDWSSDVCSSDLDEGYDRPAQRQARHRQPIAFQQAAIARDFPKRDSQTQSRIANRAADPEVVSRPCGGARWRCARGHLPDRRKTEHARAGGGYRIAAEQRHPEMRKRAPETVDRSEEHTSELQSLMRISYAVFCLKKKKKQTN